MEPEDRCGRGLAHSWQSIGTASSNTIRRVPLTALLSWLSVPLFLGIHSAISSMCRTRLARSGTILITTFSIAMAFVARLLFMILRIHTVSCTTSIMACEPHILFSIDNHNFTVIEADGQALVPLSVDSISISAGRRYSFILQANQPVDNYWIRALPESFPSNFTNGLNSAILRYVGTPEEEPKNRTWLLANALNETALHTRDNPVAPGLPYPGGRWDNGQRYSRIFMNGFKYTPPDTPTLL
jgi:hypothetical protein